MRKEFNEKSKEMNAELTKMIKNPQDLPTILQRKRESVVN